MAGDEEWDKSKYKNWVRGAKGLEYLQSGLQQFTGDKILYHRDQTVQKLTNTFPPGSPIQCNQCTLKNLLPEHVVLNKLCNKNTCIHHNYVNCFGSKPKGRRKCPNGICSKLYDEIVHAHRFKDPMWKNTDPSTWCSDPEGWSFAKCFQTTPNQGTSAAETDAAGLLSIILTDVDFQNEVACNLATKPSVFSIAREIRNDILHCPKMELEDPVLQNYVDAFIDVLQDPKCLIHDQGAKESLQSLLKLKTDEITISLNVEIKLIQARKDALAAFENLEEKEREVIINMQERKDEAVTEIEGATTAAIEKISDNVQKLTQQAEARIQHLERQLNQPIETILYSREEMPSSRCTPSLSGTDAIENEDSDTKKTKAVIDKAWGNLIDYMNPDPILKYATEYDLFGYRQTRDIREEKNTTEKNRKILEKVRARGKSGHEKLKECLKETDQSQLVELLECIERGEDTSILLLQIHEKAIDDKPQQLTDEPAPASVKQKESIFSKIFGGFRRNKLKKKDAALDKAWGKLIDYMNPDPILKCATEYGLFDCRQTREISEEKNTIDQNRKILQKVKTRGKTGYKKLKECLKKTEQSKLVELLESIERGEDISNLLQQIQEERMLKELRDKLIKFYRNQHATILLSPLVEEEDKPPLLAFYVMPELNAVKIERALGGGKEEKTQVGSLRDVFYKDNKLCSEIYLTADAGLGKTALSKRLALAWCHAKKPVTEERKYFSREATDTMAGFDLVFLLLLRDSSKDCDIDEMIFNQIVDRLADTPCTLKDLGKILSKERCLVILDGLDEWIHPPNSCKLESSAIPHRKEWECTILTTTRPWKYSVSGIRARRIDKKIEIAGLSKNAANELKKSVISHLCNEKDEHILEEHVNDFNIAVQAKGISDLEAVPLLLLYLLCLWCDERELGNTACELYSNIIELLLSRTVKQCKGVDLPLIPEYTQGDIPQCFSENESSRGFYTLLTSLGQLAFHTLFKETREENTLVFNRTVAKQYLNEQCLTFCFKTGILSQSKDLRKVSKQESKVSFAHKTVQEYFAALYMRSTLDQTSVPEIVLSKCKCVKDILEMSKILIFLSGFSANVLSLISREMMKIINEDEIALKNRSSAEQIYLVNSEPLKQFQDMCVSCCKELPDDNQVSLCLQDVFIEWSCRQEQYREHLKQLTTRNKQNIRSLYINMYDMWNTPYSSAREVIEYFGLNDLENIERICYRGKYNDGDILPLLNSSVQSLDLSCIDSSLSRLLYEKLYSLQQLEAIDIREFKMSHEQLTLLWDYISQRRCMRHIELGRLSCTDHRGSCTVGSVDLSQHSDLRTLTLSAIPVSQLHINMSAIEKCDLDLSNPDLVLRFVNCDPTDSKVKSFECRRLESPVALDACLQTLPQLWKVEDVGLWGINLDSRHVSLSPQMINIERVRLIDVAMSAGAARGLANSALTLPQPVEVDMWRCTITPREEFKTWRAEIRNSPCFRLKEDSEDWFGFVTIKDRE